MPPGNTNELLKPSQLRAYDEVVDLCRRAIPHLTRLRIAGVPMEQDEQRVQHLLQACEAIKEYEAKLAKGEV